MCGAGLNLLFNFLSGKVTMLLIEWYYGMGRSERLLFQVNVFVQRTIQENRGRALTGRGQHSVGGWCSVWEKGRSSR